MCVKPNGTKRSRRPASTLQGEDTPALASSLIHVKQMDVLENCTMKKQRHIKFIKSLLLLYLIE